MRSANDGPYRRSKASPIAVPTLDIPDDCTSSDVLIIGIGNCGRADDGLGWAFLEQLEAEKAPVNVAYRYQLQIEDAERISHHPVIIFVDATEEDLPAGYTWRSCRPAEVFNFSTHELSPETVVGLCRHLYDATPQAFVLALQGYEWGLREGLSSPAHANLAGALRFLKRTLRY